ncbi:MAG TPA: DUF3368 domain-containing protein [Elainellaceae cyanobacterium]|jgi:predicted nucleic acid-binding protein
MNVVSNTSPLSNLTLINQISLLQKIYPQILIPPTVYAELMNFSEIRPAIATLISESWLVVKTPKDIRLISALEQVLDPGEAAAIALAVELKADRLLIDERLGRSIATRHNLRLRGILGILVNAKNQGLILTTQPLLDRLISEAGFRVSQALYDFTLKESGEQ